MAMQKLSFQWDIKNSHDCDLVPNEFFDSPRFFTSDSVLKSDWKLRLYPAGYEEEIEQNGAKIGKKNNLSILLLVLLFIHVIAFHF